MSLTFVEAEGIFLLKLPKSPIPSIFPVGEEEAYIEAYDSILSVSMLDTNAETSIAFIDVISSKLMKVKHSKQGLNQAIDKVMRNNKVAIEQWLLNSTYHSKNVHTKLSEIINGSAV